MSREATKVARFLWEAELPYCSRATLRALLPVGVARPAKASAARVAQGESRYRRFNDITDNFQKALKLLEDRNLIERGHVFVKIIDHAGLRTFVAKSDPLGPGWADSLASAAGRVRKELAAERSAQVREAREREIAALHRLMIDARGANWSGRGSVRFVPRGRAL